MSKVILKVAEFTKTPGPRFKVDGLYSAEQFREDILKPAFLSAQQNKSKLIVDLDGVAGYGTSFLEETFGGLARECTTEEVKKTLEFISNDEPYLKEDIERYINEANLSYAVV